MEEFINIAAEFGPLVAIIVYIMINGGKWVANTYSDNQEFNQEITRKTLSGEYGEEDEYKGTSLVAKIAQMETDLKYQSQKMKEIETQTTNHVSEIQKDIKKMRKERGDLREKIGAMSECLDQIDKKLD